jgi:hypothetical protein
MTDSWFFSPETSEVRSSQVRPPQNLVTSAVLQRSSRKTAPRFGGQYFEEVTFSTANRNNMLEGNGAKYGSSGMIETK